MARKAIVPQKPRPGHTRRSPDCRSWQRGPAEVGVQVVAKHWREDIVVSSHESHRNRFFATEPIIPNRFLPLDTVPNIANSGDAATTVGWTPRPSVMQKRGRTRRPSYIQSTLSTASFSSCGTMESSSLEFFKNAAPIPQPFRGMNDPYKTWFRAQYVPRLRGRSENRLARKRDRVRQSRRENAGDAGRPLRPDWPTRHADRRERLYLFATDWWLGSAAIDWTAHDNLGFVPAQFRGDCSANPFTCSPRKNASKW